jgi:hypothetical protein
MDGGCEDVAGSDLQSVSFGSMAIDASDLDVSRSRLNHARAELPLLDWRADRSNAVATEIVVGFEEVVATTAMMHDWHIFGYLGMPVRTSGASSLRPLA